MTVGRRFLHALLVGLISTAAPALAQAGAESDPVWMQRMLDSWHTTSVDELGLEGNALPWIVFFGSDRVWHVNPDAERVVRRTDGVLTLDGIRYAGRELVVEGYHHDGMIDLPDGGEIPSRLILFAGSYGNPPRPYFVMAMPDIWRATPRHADDPQLAPLITGVFVHEITHTQQPGLGAAVDRIIETYGLDSEAVSDDLIQYRYQGMPGRQVRYEQERDLLYAAAAAPSIERCREVARGAVAVIRARREAWYQGDEAVYAQLEDIFLNFEGVANWAGLRAIIATGVPQDQALPMLRRGGKWWSQDEGLALVLVLERLGVPWRDSAFSEHPMPLFDLLEAAAN